MRLPVILVQNPPAAGATLAENLVGNLIGRAGLDLTLVDRFDSLAADSTDRMTLEAITVPSAILDWRSEDEILKSLAAIDFHGSRCPHLLDPIAQPSPGATTRRLFLFDLTKHRDVKKIITELDRLRESLSVKTFSLGSVGGGNRNDAGSRRGETMSVVNPVPMPAKPNKPAPAVPVLGATRTDENLDALIDQLDDLDV